MAVPTTLHHCDRYALMIVSSFKAYLSKLDEVELMVDVISNLTSDIVDKYNNDNCSSVNFFTAELKKLYEKLQSE